MWQFYLIGNFAKCFCFPNNAKSKRKSSIGAKIKKLAKTPRFYKKLAKKSQIGSKIENWPTKYKICRKIENWLKNRRFTQKSKIG